VSLRTEGPVGFQTATDNICEAGRLLHSMGMAPATSGNYSMRLDDGSFAVTVSGFHKGRLEPDNVMRVCGEGKALEDKKPSAETLLHSQIYRLFPDANACLHVHSTAGVILTRLTRAVIHLKGYEMLKIFPGIHSHDVSVKLLAVENTQDMQALCDVLEKPLPKVDIPAYIIRNHGFYVWGKDMESCLNMCEAMDHMLSVEVSIRKLRAHARNGGTK